jgi:glutamyl-tRNA synthetase
LKEKLLTFNYQLDDFSQLSTFNSQLPTIVGLVKDRVNFVPELWEQVNFFFVAPTEYDEKSLKKRWKEESPRHMQELLAVLETVSEEEWHKSYDTTDDNGNTVTRWHLDDVVMPWIAEKEYGVGIVMNAFRICLVGAARGPHIWEITNILGKEETIKRVKDALTRIDNL